ncbi:MAG: DUF4924 domain-containing protein [Draconibacterium sp.]|nr:MAG: DUF4924 domain-containing protein [Draconibacterium sp.]
MLIANQKRKENIAEYILYIYQVEDMIRAFKLDMEQIKEKLIPMYKTTESTREEIIKWYENLVLMMQKEDIREKGHFQFLTNLVSDMNQLHVKLMKTSDTEYQAIFKAVAGLLHELRDKNKTAANDIHLALDAIYGYLILKIQKKEVTTATTDAIRQLSGWMSILSKKYAESESGELDLI